MLMVVVRISEINEAAKMECDPDPKWATTPRPLALWQSHLGRYRER
jgi:hypothetical protein